ncbi:LOW QUALITY PROTEIN: uncharacterized protein LOC124498164 [Dermatophagoides farinae]|uniref:LOW QUALITY PROTEIN: uncharacterized protein LOC124498164 n=1 Tax=Dermatophagoides farinae TaxID=6954 RepID=UPI003F6090FE
MMIRLFHSIIIVIMSLWLMIIFMIITNSHALEPDWRDKIFGRSQQTMTTPSIPLKVMPTRTYWSISPSSPSSSSRSQSQSTNSFNTFHFDHQPFSTAIRQTSRIPYQFPDTTTTSSYHNNFARSQPFFISYPQTESPLSASNSYDWIRELIQTRLAESKRHLTQVEESMEKLKTKSLALTTIPTTPPPTITTTTTTLPTITTTTTATTIPDHNRIDVDYADQLVVENRDENLDYFDQQTRTNSSLKPGQRSEKIKGQKFAQTIQMNNREAWKQLMQLRSSQPHPEAGEILAVDPISNTTATTNEENVSHGITSEENNNNSESTELEPIDHHQFNNESGETRMEIDDQHQHLMEESRRMNDMDWDLLPRSINSLFGFEFNSTIKINPKTWTFQCPDNVSGFFADLSSDCQAYYHCSGHRRERFRFECPTGTRFNERSSNCDWQHNVDCHQQFDLLRA